jgi:UDP-glucuronate 4-epimerase
VTLAALIAGLEEALQTHATIERYPTQPGDVERTFADISRAQRELGYAPLTTLRQGLASFVEWLRTQPAVRAPQ